MLPEGFEVRSFCSVHSTFLLVAQHCPNVVMTFSSWEDPDGTVCKNRVFRSSSKRFSCEDFLPFSKRPNSSLTFLNIAMENTIALQKMRSFLRKRILRCRKEGDLSKGRRRCQVFFECCQNAQLHFISFSEIWSENLFFVLFDAKSFSWDRTRWSRSRLSIKRFGVRISFKGRWSFSHLWLIFRSEKSPIVKTTKSKDTQISKWYFDADQDS